MKNLFVFDVEATSLYGVAFAFGAVVYELIETRISNAPRGIKPNERYCNATGRDLYPSTIKKEWVQIDSIELLSKESLVDCVDWVKENVLPSLREMPTCETNVELRTKFYEFYMKHKDSCDIYSDVNFPVETNFLSVVVKDDLDNSQWNMPYPLLDVSNFVDVSIDRVEKYQKETGISLRKHNPLDDSIASAYCFLNR